MPDHRRAGRRCCRPAATASTASSPSAAARAPTSARPSCFFTEQEAGTPGASFVDRPAVPHVVDPHHVLRRRAHPVLRHDRPPHRAKSGAGGPTIAPIVAVYDPDAHAVRPPPRVSAETGMNALAHCIEAAWSPRAHARGRGHRPGRRRAHRRARCPRVVETPDDLDARSPHARGRRASAAAACRTRRWASTTACPSSSAAAPASPTAWPTPSSCPTPSASTPRPSPRRWTASPRPPAPTPTASPAPSPRWPRGLGLPVVAVRRRRRRRGPRGRRPPQPGQPQRPRQPPPGQRGRRPGHPRSGVLSAARAPGTGQANGSQWQPGAVLASRLIT